MITNTVERVPLNTPGGLNQRIESEMEKRLALYADHPELIEQRLSELDEEWDIERLIETEGPVTTLAGIAMAAAFGRRWLALPIFAQSMMVLHALQGWYPMLPLFRAMGFRTSKEIATERYALKSVRGDFKDLGAGGEPPADSAYDAARLHSHQA